jgi:hypothetical protein
MPTPTGLPKVGEVWEQTVSLPPDWNPHITRFVVLERGRGDYWSLRVFIPGKGRQLWVDATYHFKNGGLKYIGPAGAETKRKLGLE